MFEDLLHVPMAVENGNYLQGFRVRSINDQIGIGREELHRLIRQILALMSSTWVSGQKDDLVSND
jgi:hypothetical protein